MNDLEADVPRARARHGAASTPSGTAPQGAADPATDPASPDQPTPTRAAHAARRRVRGRPVPTVPGADAAFAAAIDAMTLTDVHQIVGAWNPAAERLFGIAAADALGRHVRDLIDHRPYGRAARGADDVDSLTLRVGSWRGRTVVRPHVGAKAGSDIVVDLVASTIRDATGRVVGTLRVSRDLTTAVRMEEAFRELTGLVFGSPPDEELQTVAARALRILVRAAAADGGSILRVGDDRVHVEVAQTGDEELDRRMERETADPGRIGGMLGRPGVVLHATIDDLPQDAATATLRRIGFVSFAFTSLPAPAGGARVLTFAWRVDGDTRPSDASLAQAGAHLAAVLENARLARELAHQVSDERALTTSLDALQDLTLAESSGDDAAARAEAVTTRLLRATQADAGVFVRVRSAADDIEVLSDVGVDRSDLARLTAGPVSAAFRSVLERGSPTLIRLADLSDPPQARLVDGAPIVTAAVLPLLVDARPEAAVVLGYRRVPDRPTTLRLLTHVARIASIALANERLRERLTRTAQDERSLAQQLAALQDLTLLGPQSEDLASLARATLDRVVAATGASVAAYDLVDVEADRMSAVATVGADPGLLTPAPGAPARARTTVRRFLAGDAAFVSHYDDPSLPPETRSRAAATGLASYAALPIRVEGQLEGIIFLAWPTGSPHPLPDTRGLDAIARLASISLANLRLRDRMAASERRYRTLFEESPEAYFLVSLGGIVLAANDAAANLFRRSNEELAGMPMGDLTGAPHGTRGAGRAAVEAGDAHVARSTAVRGDGSRFPYLAVSRRVEVDGEARILTMIHDLSDEERLQQELLQAQKMEAIGQLVSGVAHELNNPLAAIVAFSQLLRRDGRLPEDMRHDADLLVQEADRTRRIVGNLLDFARQRPPERHPTRLGPLVQSVLDLQSYSLSAGEIAVEVDVPDTLPPVELDRSQMQQVLLNLTLNAIQSIRSTGRPGRISIVARLVAVAPGRTVVRLAVADDGPGVPERLRDRLFMPFFTTKEPGEGTGLGLSVSFGIVAAHGGRLTHEPDGVLPGARFVVELPARPSEEAAGAGPEAGEGPGEADWAPEAVPVDRSGRAPDRGDAAGTRGGPEMEQPAGAGSAPAARRAASILVLDDEPSIRAFLAKALGLAGWEARTAADGREALDILDETHVDALLVDHRMAGMSGTDLFEAATRRWPELASRFIFMSGDVLNPELKAFAEERSVGLLAKPFDVDTVQRAVARLLERVGRAD